MKAHGKGIGISINGGHSTLNHWKASMTDVNRPKNEFQPLRSYPAVPHPTRQAELDERRAMPSWKASDAGAA